MTGNTLQDIQAIATLMCGAESDAALSVKAHDNKVEFTISLPKPGQKQQEKFSIEAACRIPFVLGSRNYLQGNDASLIKNELIKKHKGTPLRYILPLGVDENQQGTFADHDRFETLEEVRDALLNSEINLMLACYHGAANYLKDRQFPAEFAYGAPFDNANKYTLDLLPHLQTFTGTNQQGYMTLRVESESDNFGAEEVVNLFKIEREDMHIEEGVIHLPFTPTECIAFLAKKRVHSVEMLLLDAKGNIGLSMRKEGHKELGYGAIVGSNEVPYVPGLGAVHELKKQVKFLPTAKLSADMVEAIDVHQGVATYLAKAELAALTAKEENRPFVSTAPENADFTYSEGKERFVSLKEIREGRVPLYDEAIVMRYLAYQERTISEYFSSIKGLKGVKCHIERDPAHKEKWGRMHITATTYTPLMRFKNYLKKIVPEAIGDLSYAENTAKQPTVSFLDTNPHMLLCAVQKMLTVSLPKIPPAIHMEDATYSNDPEEQEMAVYMKDAICNGDLIEVREMTACNVYPNIQHEGKRYTPLDFASIMGKPDIADHFKSRGKPGQVGAVEKAEQVQRVYHSYMPDMPDIQQVSAKNHAALVEVLQEAYDLPETERHAIKHAKKADTLYTPDERAIVDALTKNDAYDTAKPMLRHFLESPNNGNTSLALHETNYHDSYNVFSISVSEKDPEVSYQKYPFILELDKEQALKARELDGAITLPKTEDFTMQRAKQPVCLGGTRVYVHHTFDGAKNKVTHYRFVRPDNQGEIRIDVPFEEDIYHEDVTIPDYIRMLRACGGSLLTTKDKALHAALIEQLSALKNREMVVPGRINRLQDMSTIRERLFSLAPSLQEMAELKKMASQVEADPERQAQALEHYIRTHHIEPYYLHESFISAIKAHKVEVVKAFLKQGVDLRLGNNEALRTALAVGNVEIQRLLLTVGSANNANHLIIRQLANADSFSPPQAKGKDTTEADYQFLLSAVRSSNPETIRLFTEACNKFAERLQKDAILLGDNPKYMQYLTSRVPAVDSLSDLMQVIGEPQLVKKRIKDGANVLEKHTQYGVTALDIAAMRGDVESFNLIFSKMHFSTKTDERSAFEYAIEHNHVQIMTYYVKEALKDERRYLIKKLNMAVAQNRPTLLKLLLQTIELRHVEDDALYIAAQNGHRDVIEILVNADNTILNRALNEERETMLMVASAEDRHELVEYLSSHHFCQKTRTDKHDRTAMHHAAQAGSNAAVAVLMKAGMSFKAPAGSREITPFMEAIIHDQPDTVAMMLQYDPNMLKAVDKAKNTVFHLAAEHNAFRSLSYLLARKLPAGLIDKKNSDHETAFDVAVKLGRLAVVPLLLRHTIIAQAVLSKALRDSIRALKTDMASLLWQKGVHLDETTGEALHYAAKVGHADFIRFMLVWGVKVDVPNAEGATALHTAIQSGHLKAIQVLLEGGADTEVVYVGHSLLYIAIQMQCEHTVKLLIAAGADPLAHEGDALKFAVMSRKKELIFACIRNKSGAVDDARGFYALKEAIKHQDLETVKLLITEKVPLFYGSETPAIFDSFAMNDIAILAELLAYKTLDNQGVYNGQTPLQYLFSQKGEAFHPFQRLNAIRLLMQQGASLKELDTNVFSTKQLASVGRIAVLHGYEDITYALLAHSDAMKGKVCKWAAKLRGTTAELPFHTNVIHDLLFGIKDATTPKEATRYDAILTKNEWCKAFDSVTANITKNADDYLQLLRPSAKDSVVLIDDKALHQTIRRALLIAFKLDLEQGNKPMLIQGVAWAIAKKEIRKQKEEHTVSQVLSIIEKAESYAKEAQDNIEDIKLRNAVAASLPTPKEIEVATTLLKMALEIFSITTGEKATIEDLGKDRRNFTVHQLALSIKGHTQLLDECTDEGKDARGQIAGALAVPFEKRSLVVRGLKSVSHLGADEDNTFSKFTMKGYSLSLLRSDKPINEFRPITQFLEKYNTEERQPLLPSTLIVDGRSKKYSHRETVLDGYASSASEGRGPA